MKYEGWPIYGEAEIARMAAAAEMLSRMFGHLARLVRPGVSTAELDAQAEAFLRAEGAEPAFKGYQPPFEEEPYPYTLCISIDSEVVHGLPSATRLLQPGQIVSIDCGVRLEGFYADMAYTFPVGSIAPPLQKLLWVTQQALERGIACARAGATLGDIGAAIHQFVRSYAFSVSENLTGHGIGKALHMPPDVPNVGKAGSGPRLPENLVLAIEPMVQMGTRRVKRGPEGWAVVTADGLPAAHFEHTVVVRRSGAQVLTSYEPIHKALVRV